MKVTILNNFYDFPQKVEYYQNMLSAEFDKEKKKTSIAVYIALAASALLILLGIISFFQSKFAAVVFAALGIIGLIFAFVLYNTPFTLGYNPEFWKNYHEGNNKEKMIEFAVHKNLGWYLHIMDILDNDRLLKISFVNGDDSNEINAYIYYNSENKMVYDESINFEVKLSSDDMYRDTIVVDFLNKRVTKYYSDTIHTNVFYQFTVEPFLISFGENYQNTEKINA